MGAFKSERGPEVPLLYCWGSLPRCPPLFWGLPNWGGVPKSPLIPGVFLKTPGAPPPRPRTPRVPPHLGEGPKVPLPPLSNSRPPKISITLFCKNRKVPCPPPSTGGGGWAVNMAGGPPKKGGVSDVGGQQRGGLPFWRGGGARCKRRGINRGESAEGASLCVV